MSYLGKNLGNWQAETLLLREAIRSIFDEKFGRSYQTLKCMYTLFHPSRDSRHLPYRANIYQLRQAHIFKDVQYGIFIMANGSDLNAHDREELITVLRIHRLEYYTAINKSEVGLHLLTQKNTLRVEIPRAIIISIS